ncbi:hypothetical protein BDY19DRAFT_993323 [Irpex rosettiformis]|uniref:Uncharacterized protein n=1 Tax=Irpex rosettiformis TaxID=378272 RepID=A0ACB8U4C5_9APHY|nr:hypothetical protein BDY19DRAFT_993323 [Irpex rosettiformis]
MSDTSRQASPRLHSTSISASPSRPSPLSRPHWPYSTHSTRPPSTSSATSMASANASLMTLGSSWDYRSSAGTPGPSGLTRKNSNLNSSNNMTDGNKRHWSFTAFEWVVKDVHRLRDHIELSDKAQDISNADTFDVLTEEPMLADGKFKLEIGKKSSPDPVETTNNEPSVIRAQPPTLSLYVVSVMLEYAHADYEISSSMFAGIKCQDDCAGERGARPEWAWEFWQNDWVFREDSEVWECPLPPLSSLLENPRIRETDSFVICVQIHCPIGPFFPHQPSVSYVPKDLLNGLEAMLDNANTGDVQFVCLERKEESHAAESVPNSPGTETPHTQRSSSSASTTSVLPSVARKRVIYAHSDILIHRSEYFATMLNSSFAENAARTPGDRKTYTVMVEEADFVTIYWLLKWVYANWLLFKQHDNPKLAVEGVGEGWSAKSLDSLTVPDEWAWVTFNKGELVLDPLDAVVETRSATSNENVGDKGTRSSNANHNPPVPRTPSSARLAASPSKASQASSSSASSRPPPSPTRRATSGAPTASSSTLAVPQAGPAPKSPPSPRSSNVTLPPPISTPGYASNTHHPLSPLKQRQRSRPSGASAPDPHSHPTVAPPPASALSMYQVAHRYAMPGLAALSLEHMMSTIAPESSFALLLASSTWDELHSFVEDYVVDKWDEVSVSADFEQCCQEVAAGEWGPEGGKTLMALFRRLRSPLSVGRT